METVLKDNQNLLRSPENLNGSWRNLGIISKEDRNLGQELAENSCESRHNLGQTIPAESRNLYESVMSLVFGGCTLIFIDFWGSAKVVALIFVLFPILSVVEVLIKARAAKLYLVIKAIFPSLYSLFDFFFPFSWSSTSFCDVLKIVKGDLFVSEAFSDNLAFVKHRDLADEAKLPRCWFHFSNATANCWALHFCGRRPQENLDTINSNGTIKRTQI